MESSDRAQQMIVGRIEDHIATIQRLLTDSQYLASVTRVGQEIIRALQTGHKVLFFGNGGSAADASHLAGELIGRFLSERRSLAGLALCNVSSLTAIGNDYGFDLVFARQIEGLGTAGDIAFAISTSGHSPNVLRAIEVAREKSLVTVGLTGRGGKLSALVDHCISIPADRTPRIQEAHILTGHILCEMVEHQLLNGGQNLL